jgi:hypothetical protein
MWSISTKDIPTEAYSQQFLNVHEECNFMIKQYMVRTLKEEMKIKGVGKIGRQSKMSSTGMS